MLRVRSRWHLFHEFLLVNLSFLPDTDVIMNDIIVIFCLLHYGSRTHSFQL